MLTLKNYFITWYEGIPNILNKFLNSVALFNLYSRWFELYSSIMYNSMLKEILLNLH